MQVCTTLFSVALGEKIGLECKCWDNHGWIKSRLTAMKLKLNRNTEATHLNCRFVFAFSPVQFFWQSDHIFGVLFLTEPVDA